MINEPVAAETYPADSQDDIDAPLLARLPLATHLGPGCLYRCLRLTAREQSDAFRIDSSGVRNMRILVRCFALASQDQTRRAGQKVSKFPPHCWPLESLVRLNTTVPVNIKQVRGPLHTPARGARWCFTSPQ